MEEIVSLTRLLRNLDTYQDIFHYLFFQYENKPVYFSANKLMDLCSKDRNQIYYQLSKIQDSGLEVDVITEVTSEEIQDTIFTKDSLAVSLINLSQDDSVKSRRRNFYTITENRISIDIPVRPEVDNDISSIGTLNLGKVTLDDPQLQAILGILSKEPYLDFLCILTSSFHGMMVESVYHKYSEMDFEKYEFLSTILQVSPKSISIKKLVDLDLVSAVYNPQVQFSPNVDRIEFEIIGEPSQQFEVISKSNRFIAR